MSNPTPETTIQSTPSEALESALRGAVITYLETDSSEQETIAALKQQIQATQQTLDLPSIQTALDALTAAEAEQLEQKKAHAAAAWQVVAESLNIRIAPPRRKAKPSAKRLSSSERQGLIAKLTAALQDKIDGLTSQELASVLSISQQQTKRLLQDPETQALIQRRGHARHSRYVLKPAAIP